MRYVHLLFLCLLSQPAAAQMPHQDSAAEIQQDMRKLAVLGNVLYLAAHPDDENTRFIAYAANELLFNTSYLSLTRGDGGQNLVGPEIREELGIIRTQELLAARRTDGGQQFFTRANDFGYSKTAEETLAIWDEDKILSDVVRVIRQVRPDVIVCRFPVDGGGGHGHHTASALLGLKAFALAAQPDSYPEQLKSLQTWQPQRIVVNTGRWWNPDISTEDPGVVSLNVGAYNTLRGTSYTELAARSRTMHKSQGFGSTGSRGEELEFFEHLAGSPAEQDLFDGVSTDWGRLSGSESIAKQVAALNAQFQSGAPEESIPGLLALRKSLQDLSDPFWRTQKIAEVNSLIQACAGLYLEATADVHWAAPGQNVNIDLELVARNVEGVRWVGFDVPALSLSESKNQQLALNIKAEHRFPIRIPANMAPTDPYWLIQKGTLGTYRVDDPSLIGTPETSPPIELELILEIAGEPLNYRIPLVFKWNDPVQGERYRPFSICPAAFVNFSESSHVFTGDQAKEIELKIKAIVPNFSGAVQLLDAPGWEFTPKSWPVSFEKQGEEQSFRVTVQPLADAQPLDLSVQLQSDGRTLDRSLNTIAYDHIPTQVYMPSASCRLVYVDLKTKGQRIAYIPGAGDVVPTALRNIGYSVDELSETDITAGNLAQYDAVITGIRLLNVDERVGHYMPALLEYCRSGGTLVLQYNTRHALKTESFSPYPITLSRDRVTEEDAAVRFLAPEHAVLNQPNKLTPADFDGWVQERGLYFPSAWDEAYQAILSWNDRGEEPKDGSLLVAAYGEGFYVYSGISFFRELPAGVPGAYRLLVNLLSLGHE